MVTFTTARPNSHTGAQDATLYLGRRMLLALKKRKQNSQHSGRTAVDSRLCYSPSECDIMEAPGKVCDFPSKCDIIEVPGKEAGKTDRCTPIDVAVLRSSMRRNGIGRFDSTDKGIKFRLASNKLAGEVQLAHHDAEVVPIWFVEGGCTYVYFDTDGLSQYGGDFDEVPTLIDHEDHGRFESYIRDCIRDLSGAQKRGVGWCIFK